MLESGIELINVEVGLNYEPTYVSTDKRVLNYPTSLGYWQVGEIQQYGFAKGPIFKLDFVDFTNVGETITHVKIWGIENKDDSAVLFPLSYLEKFPTVHIYLKKFIFCDSDGNEIAPEGDYNIIAYKKKVMPLVW